MAPAVCQQVFTGDPRAAPFGGSEPEAPAVDSQELERRLAELTQSVRR